MELGRIKSATNLHSTYLTLLLDLGWVGVGLFVLFVVRGLQRFAFQGEIATAVGIESGRNIGNAVFFLLMAAALVWLFRAANKSANA